MHGLPRNVHLGDEHAAAFRLRDVQMSILWASVGHIGGVRVLAGVDAPDGLTQGGEHPHDAAAGVCHHQVARLINGHSVGARAARHLNKDAWSYQARSVWQ